MYVSMVNNNSHQLEEVRGGAVVRNSWEWEGHRGWQGGQEGWGTGAIHEHLCFGAPRLAPN